MKKITHIFAIVLSVALIFSLAACDSETVAEIEEQLGEPIVESIGDLEDIDVEPREEEDFISYNAPEKENAVEEEEEILYEGSSQPQSVLLEREVLATSDDVGLYKVHTSDGRVYVAGDDGRAVVGYQLDDKENIVDAHGQIVVAWQNAKEFVPIKNMSFTKQSYVLDLHTQEDIVNNNEYITRVNQYVTNVPIILNVSPSNISNGIILVRTSDTSLAEIRQNSNKPILAEGQFNLENGEVAIKAVDPTQPITIMVSMKQIGTVRIFAEAITGTAKAECTITPDYGYVESIPVPTVPPTEYLNASGNAENHYHVHTYAVTVIDPTPTSQGYTEYRCVDCGHTYTDNYVAKLAAPDPTPEPHMHSYNATVIPPTETEQGYTLYTCSCGDSYKDSFTPPIGA